MLAEKKNHDQKPPDLFVASLNLKIVQLFDCAGILGSGRTEEIVQGDEQYKFRCCLPPERLRLKEISLNERRKKQAGWSLHLYTVANLLHHETWTESGTERKDSISRSVGESAGKNTSITSTNESVSTLARWTLRHFP